jgi:glycerol-3-phosphate cytidylyltransferase-like family protein
MLIYSEPMSLSSKPSAVSGSENSTVLDRQVFLTVAYTDQFGYPLTATEVCLRLINSSAGKGLDGTSFDEVSRALSRLVKLGLVERKGPWYFLPGREEWVGLRTGRAQAAERKWLEVDSFVRLVRWVPWIWGVAVSGSLAVNNPVEDDDVDFMIVTQPGRLWLVRVLVWLMAVRVGKRRSWHREEKNSWCFNLWLEADSLALSSNRHNIYTAYEVCQTVWVMDRRGTVRQFYDQNSWVEHFLPEFYRSRIGESQRLDEADWSVMSLAIKLSSPFWRLLNGLLYFLQYLYMRRHMTREVVDLGGAFFHPRDTRRLVFARWRQSVAMALAALAKRQGEKVVLATGVFDLMHEEHRQFLSKAGKLGYLVVGVESDVRVRQLKGVGRPLQNHFERLRRVMEVEGVRAAFVLPEHFSQPHHHRRLVHELKPDLLAVSSHTAHLDRKRKIVAEVGGRVKVIHQHNPQVSTTAIMKGGWIERPTVNASLGRYTR